MEQPEAACPAADNNLAALSVPGANHNISTTSKQLEEHTLSFQNSNKAKMIAGSDQAFSQRVRQGQVHQGTMSFQDINAQTANFNRMASSNQY